PGGWGAASAGLRARSLGPGRGWARRRGPKPLQRAGREVRAVTDIERRLREAMLAAVDGELPPADLVGRVLRMHRRYLARAVGAAGVRAGLLAAGPGAIAVAGAGPRPPQPIAPGAAG